MYFRLDNPVVAFEGTINTVNKTVYIIKGFLSGKQRNLTVAE